MSLEMIISSSTTKIRARDGGGGEGEEAKFMGGKGAKVVCYAVMNEIVHRVPPSRATS